MRRLIAIAAVMGTAYAGWQYSKVPEPPAAQVAIPQAAPPVAPPPPPPEAPALPEPMVVTTTTTTVTTTEVIETTPLPAPVAAAPTKVYRIEPDSSGFGKLNLHGWTVRVAAELTSAQPALAQQALALLDRKLGDIVAAVPADRVSELRAVPIWMSAQVQGLHGMQYHWSADWLREHGYNPAKARSVEIAEAATFISWEPDQPWFVLHELAHALHDRRLGGNNEQVLAAFRNAQARGLYQSVKRNNGQTGPAYALNNDKEYFAELTEAYFGINDFFPFNRADLRQYDPAGYALMESVWLGK